jgi:hypothetical protein
MIAHNTGHWNSVDLLPDLITKLNNPTIVTVTVASLFLPSLMFADAMDGLSLLSIWNYCLQALTTRYKLKQLEPSQDSCKIGFLSRNFAMPLSSSPQATFQYPQFSWIWLKYSLVSSFSSLMQASSMLLIKMPPISTAFHPGSLPVQCHLPPKPSLLISNTMFTPFGVSAPHNAASSLCCFRAMPPAVKSFYGLGVVSCQFLFFSACRTGKHLLSPE